MPAYVRVYDCDIDCDCDCVCVCVCVWVCICIFETDMMQVFLSLVTQMQELLASEMGESGGKGSCVGLSEKGLEGERSEAERQKDQICRSNPTE